MSDIDTNNSDQTNQISGIFNLLGDPSDGTVITEKALAQIFSRHIVSIKRAIQRGELPPPTKLLGEQVWTINSIQEHLKKRLEDARKEAEKEIRRIKALMP